MHNGGAGDAIDALNFCSYVVVVVTIIIKRIMNKVRRKDCETDYSFFQEYIWAHQGLILSLEEPSYRTYVYRWYHKYYDRHEISPWISPGTHTTGQKPFLSVRSLSSHSLLHRSGWRFTWLESILLIVRRYTIFAREIIIDYLYTTNIRKSWLKIVLKTPKMIIKHFAETCLSDTYVFFFTANTSLVS